ncbi:hypothetical protein ACFYE2_17990, partial [Kocuria sp. CPCC 205300]|uniref:hypothetical protein n=1 Tax=Kocuria sabuli TaxID=3071448 RepID=UPI0036D8E8E9
MDGKIQALTENFTSQISTLSAEIKNLKSTSDIKVQTPCNIPHIAENYAPVPELRCSDGTQRDIPPHLKGANNYLSDNQSPPPVAQERGKNASYGSQAYQERKQQCEPHYTPQAEVPRHNNPFMRNSVPPQSNNPRQNTPYRTLDMVEINKLMPPIKDWPKFDGKGEYDHMNFIRTIDHMLRSYRADEEAVISRMPRLFEGVAADWFIT